MLKKNTDKKTLIRLAKNWEELANIDPMYAILVAPDKYGKLWSADGFFNTGLQEINELIILLNSFNIDIEKKRALDFGCGVGRLTQPLANYFDEVIGLDISSKMIEVANIYNSKNNIKYIVNNRSDLFILENESINFIYSNLVLQHIPFELNLRYFEEFSRILTKKGILVFQMPERMKNHILDILWNNMFTHKIIYPIFLKFRTKLKSKMGLHPIRKKNIYKILKINSLEFLTEVKNENAGTKWISYTYIVRKLDENT